MSETEKHDGVSSPYMPLKITAFLQTPVICDAAGFLPLDSILAYHAYREAYGFQEFTLPNQGADDKKFVRLPIKRCNRREHRGEQWYYACSFAQWNEAETVKGSDYWTKRFDAAESFLVDFGTRKAKVETSSGFYKGYRIPVFYRHTKSVSWYAVGEKGKLENLLRFCNYLGKKTSQGYGAVLDWQVEDFHSDWSVYDDKEKLMRAIPKANGVLYGIRPSYWNPRHQFLCALP